MKKNNSESEIDPTKKAILLSAHKCKTTPPIIFTLDDVQDIIKSRKVRDKTPAPIPTTSKSTPSQLNKSKFKKISKKVSEKKRVLGAASLTDILGFNPDDLKSRPISQIDESKISRKNLKYYRALVELRLHVKKGLDLHTKDTLKRSSKEDTGDLSSYSQHMADAGTDTFDRDFALNLLSNEQDALYEIEEAIQRIIDNAYGICEITGENIALDRLEAVPFTRYSLEGQKQLEASKQNKGRERSSLFS